MTAVSRRGHLGASLVVLAIGIVFLLWAQTYPRNTGTVPTLVGVLTIVLGLFDLAAQSRTALGRAVARFAGRGESAMDGRPDDASWPVIVLSILWPLGYVAATILAGFLLVTPLYVLCYMWIHGGKPLLSGAVSAAITTLSIWLTFEVLFRYPLYPGVLFGGYL
jgi:hypothetical protein